MGIGQRKLNSDPKTQRVLNTREKAGTHDTGDEDELALDKRTQTKF